jgi:hypothetical protein
LDEGGTGGEDTEAGDVEEGDLRGRDEVEEVECHVNHMATTSAKGPAGIWGASEEVGVGVGAASDGGDFGNAGDVLMPDPLDGLEIPPSSPLPSTISSKRRFSAIDDLTGSETAHSKQSSSLRVTSSSAASAKGHSVEAIALTNIGHNFADINSTLWMGIEMEQARFDARKAEWIAREDHGDVTTQAMRLAQQMETHLTYDELAALLEILEDSNIAKGYIQTQNDDLRKAWVKQKLVVRGLAADIN